MTDTELLEAIRAMVRDELQGILRSMKRSRRDHSMLSIRAFAEVAGVSRSTVAEWIARKKVRTVPFGRQFRIPASELDRIQREGVNAA